MMLCDKGSSKKILTTSDSGSKDCHREIDFAHIYFPQADIHIVDATKSPAVVANEIRKVLPK